MRNNWQVVELLPVKVRVVENVVCLSSLLLQHTYFYGKENSQIIEDYGKGDGISNTIFSKGYVRRGIALLISINASVDRQF